MEATQKQQAEVSSSLPVEVVADGSAAASASAAQPELSDPGLAVPVTPPREYVVIDSPMSSPTAREAHGDDGE